MRRTRREWLPPPLAGVGRCNALAGVVIPQFRAMHTAAMPVRTTRLSGFSDALVAGGRWETLRRRSAADVAFLTREWLEPWWETLGHGELLLVAALDDDSVVAVAPFLLDAGEVSFLGAFSADRIDFVGDVSSTEVLD